MSLKHLATTAALSASLLGCTASEKTVKTVPARVEPPETKVELYEEPPEDPPGLTAEGKERLAFYERSQAFSKAIPDYAESLWGTVFTTSNDEVVYVTTETKNGVQAGETATVNKDSTWTTTYLKDELPSEFHRHIHRSIQGSYRDKASQLNDDLEHVVTTRWNSGRRTTIETNLSRYGEFINAYDKVFDHVDLPSDAAAQILVESGFNPAARSAYACGPGQIHRYHLRTYPDKDEVLPNCDNPVKNAELAAKTNKAQKLVYDETWWQSSSRYHSGFQNAELIKGVGARQTTSDDEFKQFTQGLRTFLNNTADGFTQHVGNALSATRHYPVQLHEARSVYDTISDTVQTTPLSVTDPRRATSFSDVKQTTGLPDSVINSYNPHLDETFGRHAHVILPDSTSLPGEDTTPWHKYNGFKDDLATYDFSTDPDTLSEEINVFQSRADSLGLDMWAFALHVVHNNHEALQSADHLVANKIRDATRYLNRHSNSGSGAAR